MKINKLIIKAGFFFAFIIAIQFQSLSQNKDTIFYHDFQIILEEEESNKFGFVDSRAVLVKVEKTYQGINVKSFLDDSVNLKINKPLKGYIFEKWLIKNEQYEISYNNLDVGNYTLFISCAPYGEVIKILKINKTENKTTPPQSPNTIQQKVNTE